MLTPGDAVRDCYAHPWLSQTARLEPSTPIQVVPDRRSRYEPVAQVLAAAQRAHVQNLGVRSFPAPF